MHRQICSLADSHCHCFQSLANISGCSPWELSNFTGHSPTQIGLITIQLQQTACSACVTQASCLEPCRKFWQTDLTEGTNQLS